MVAINNKVSKNVSIYVFNNEFNSGNFEDVCMIAASCGHLNLLKYAHENGCPWDQRTCSYAASKGHLKCLKYAHENDCPWAEDTPANASLNLHSDCLNYALENGCPCYHRSYP